jgi:excinuclease ABC subunit C
MDEAGKVLYVGKAKRVKARVLSYFHAKYPDDKAARIIRAAANITWDYVPSEFAAHLAELKEIRRHRPAFNHHMNRRRRVVFITTSPGVAPRLAVTTSTARGDLRYFGPFTSPARATAALRVLNDLLKLRDCAERMPAVFPGQGDLFDAPRQAACPRYEFGTCSGPCAGFVEETTYRGQVETALLFLGGYGLSPVSIVVDAMVKASERSDFELAARWREKFERLEWLLTAGSRARSGIEGLTFIYRDPGPFGDDRVYLIRHGLIRAAYPYPATPIEAVAFRAVVETDLLRPMPPAGLLDASTLDEMLLVMSWFRRHPEAWRRTVPIQSWLDGDEIPGLEAA